MTKILTSKNKSISKKIAIVVSRFNEFITKRLLDGCLDELVKCGVKKSDIVVAWVPGAFEIPVTALKFAKKKNIAGVICLGAIIRGDTLHYELVAEGATIGIMNVSTITGKPIIFEVLAVDTIEDANKRSKVKGCNKGREAAQTAVEMISLLSQI